MANYASLKAAIQEVIKTNGNNEITGALLQQSLLAMINALGGYYQFVGIATPETNPGTPDQNVLYFAGVGTYPNFNGTVITNGHLGVFSYNGSWHIGIIETGMPPIADNLTTDNGDIALSARQGKILKELIDVINAQIFGENTPIDVQSQPQISGLSIDTQNLWHIYSSSIQSSFIQLSTAGRYLIEAVNGLCVFALLNSSTYTDGGTPDFVTGYEGRQTIQSGNSLTVVVPAGKYLWYRRDASAPIPRVTLLSDGAFLRTSDVINSLSSNEEHKPLSAKQGNVLATMNIDAERVIVPESGNITIGGESANSSAVANNDFRYPKYPAIGYNVKKVFITGNQSRLVTIGVYTPNVGISNQQQVQMINGTTSIAVDINVPVGSYLCIGNAIGLMFSTIGAIYGSYNINTNSDSSADLSFWFESAADSISIKGYVDQRFDKYFPDSIIQIFPKLTGVGDSLMAGYTHQGSTIIDSATARSAGNNWITYLAKRNGLTINNLAIGSSTAHNWRYADGPSAGNLADISAANIPTDCYFIGIGVNDLRQTLTVGVPTDIKPSKENNSDTFFGNYDYIIRQCLEYNPNCNILTFTIPNSENGNSGYNEAIKYISNLYARVHCIDLSLISDFTTGIIPNCFANGHYDPLAYNLISSIIENEINKYIKNHYTLFKVTPY